MGSYDRMQVCENGHQITDSASNLEFQRKFCTTCGASTIMECPACNHPIKGYYHVEGVITLGNTTPVPKYCEGCGTPFPWQASAIRNLEAVLAESDLSESELEKVHAALPDVIRDTPMTESASLKLHNILKKVGKPIYDVAIKVVSDIASETAKKQLGL